MGTVNSVTSPWLSNQTITSPEGRLALAASWMKSPSSSIQAETGVVEGATPTASASGTTCTVTAHQAIVEASGGTYVCTTAASLAVPLDAVPAAGTSRYDLIVGEIVDSSDSAVYRLRSVTGSASASPSIPGTPSNTTLLFRVQVTNSGAQTPVAAFGYTRAPGGIRLVAAGDTRAGSFVGDLRKFTSGQIDVWNGTLWQTVVAPAAWTQFTPVLYSQAGAMNMGSTGSAIGRYLVAGKVMHLRYIFRQSGSGSSSGWGDVYTQLPPGITSAPSEETQILAKLNAHWPLGTLDAIYLGKCFIPPSSNAMTLYFPFDAGRSALATYQCFATNAGVLGSGRPLISGGAPLPGVLVIQGTIEIS